ncbi:hypothetical protein QQ045_024450 [Rhodiola kirilowii]
MENLVDSALLGGSDSGVNPTQIGPFSLDRGDLGLRQHADRLDAGGTPVQSRHSGRVGAADQR